jgi:uncharacterized protein (DUF1499 family)
LFIFKVSLVTIYEYRQWCFVISTVFIAIGLGGCASPVSVAGSTGQTNANRAALACTLPSNCASSLGGGEMAPLRYQGTAEQGMALLLATLATFTEAKLVTNDATALEAVFTTPVGFRDQVEFKIDAQAQQIDYRSRSNLGLFDFGKNRSRMLEFAARFAKQQP